MPRRGPDREPRQIDQRPTPDHRAHQVAEVSDDRKNGLRGAGVARQAEGREQPEAEREEGAPVGEAAPPAGDPEQQQDGDDGDPGEHRVAVAGLGQISWDERQVKHANGAGERAPDFERAPHDQEDGAGQRPGPQPLPRGAARHLGTDPPPEESRP